MTDKPCAFCESLQTYKFIRAFNNEHSEHFEPKIYEEYTVALVVRHWTKGNKRTAGRTTDYRNRGIGFKLNFCPECGRRIANDRI